MKIALSGISYRALALAASGLFCLLAPVQSQAAQLVTNNPIVGTEFVTLNVSATNNDTGAIYNSAELNVFITLATDLYALPANQTNYASIADLIADWDFSIRSSAPGNVYNGWNAQKENDGSVSISNNDFDWDQWNSNPGSNTQAYTLLVPIAQVDFTGVSGYNPDKAGIVLSGAGNTMSDAFVGYEGGAANISHFADSQFYQVAIPEPKAFAIIFGLAALGAGLYRRRQKETNH